MLVKDRAAGYQSLRENKIDAFADDGELLSIVKMFDRRISTRKLRVQY